MNNKFSEYRDIRYKRAFRTLGKMSIWRVVVGAALMVYVFLLSGLVSQMLASRMQFVAAEKLMISPAWMEQYKPETKAFIEAGVLYQNGDYVAASDAFSRITELDAATSMKSASDLRLALGMLSAGDADAAYDSLIAVDSSLLSDDDTELYFELCSDLYDIYISDAERAMKLQDMLEVYSE